jgi:hypothetical protein
MEILRMKVKFGVIKKYLLMITIFQVMQKEKLFLTAYTIFGTIVEQCL